MKKYIRVAEVAANASVCTSTIWRWVRQGLLPEPFRPTKRTTLWEADEVQAALDDIQGNVDNKEYRSCIDK